MSVEAFEVTFESCSVDETLALGAALGKAMSGSLTVGLVGPLGAGKTHFVKGIALGNSIAEGCQVTSPTFTLVHEYAGRLTLFHLDAYRLKSSAELLTLGFDDFEQEGSAVIVEWADRVRSVMPSEMMWVEISATADTSRSICAKATGAVAVSCLHAWKAGSR